MEKGVELSRSHKIYCRRMLKYREIIRITNTRSGIYGKM